MTDGAYTRLGRRVAAQLEGGAGFEDCDGWEIAGDVADLRDAYKRAAEVLSVAAARVHDSWHATEGKLRDVGCSEYPCVENVAVLDEARKMGVLVRSIDRRINRHLVKVAELNHEDHAVAGYLVEELRREVAWLRSLRRMIVEK